MRVFDWRCSPRKNCIILLLNSQHFQENSSGVCRDEQEKHGVFLGFSGVVSVYLVGFLCVLYVWSSWCVFQSHFWGTCQVGHFSFVRYLEVLVICDRCSVTTRMNVTIRLTAAEVLPNYMLETLNKCLKYPRLQTVSILKMTITLQSKKLSKSLLNWRNSSLFQTSLASCNHFQIQLLLPEIFVEVLHNFVKVFAIRY